MREPPHSGASSLAPPRRTPDTAPQPQGTGQDATQTDKSDRQMRRVIGNLYECHVDDRYCSHRFSFGNGYYCAWMLKDSAIAPGDVQPCMHQQEENRHAD
jgi:hypothetical protein